MVTRTSDPSHLLPALDHTGVVLIATDQGSGTGTLLPGGRAVLTAAHVVAGAAAVHVHVDTMRAG